MALLETRTDSELYRPTTVAQSRVLDPSLATTEEIFDSEVIAVLNCAMEDGCNLVCQDAFQTANFFLTNLIISLPFYDNTGGTELLCWSTRPMGSLLSTVSGITITGSPNIGGRVVGNLIDSVYGFTLGECFGTDSLANPYFLLDFGVELVIRRVMLRAQADSAYAVRFRDISVMLGLDTNGTDFSDFNEIGFLSGGAPYPDYEFDVPVIPAQIARYVAVQRQGIGHLQVCHIDVY